MINTGFDTLPAGASMATVALSNCETGIVSAGIISERNNLEDSKWLVWVYQV